MTIDYCHNVVCVCSKIQMRQWFVTNYSNSCCLDYTMHITIFSLDMNCFCQVPSYMLSSPLESNRPCYCIQNIICRAHDVHAFTVINYAF